MSIKSVAEFTHLKANVLNDYYKNHLSGFHSWNQKNIQMSLLFPDFVTQKTCIL